MKVWANMQIYNEFWKDPRAINMLSKGTITYVGFGCRLKVKSVQHPVAAWVTEKTLLRKFYIIPAAVMCKKCFKEPKYLIKDTFSYCLCEECIC